MSTIYESSAIVNSWNAVDEETKLVIPCDQKGFITPAKDTTIIFENPNDESTYKYVDVSTLVFTNGKSPTKLVINDNDKYPFYLDPYEVRGFDYIRIWKFKVIETGGFYYEGLTSRS